MSNKKQIARRDIDCRVQDMVLDEKEERERVRKEFNEYMEDFVYVQSLRDIVELELGKRSIL